ncbi:KH domain-containing, RNA-binding, signal transduction-associated protein 1b [Nerophis lumbriciformis]|uniref:KH domain-containing, RNA-binding, signal transduction-associated protein 1b n=1 Tax=Nerophis lumbriciformis TaxID=546530 RepID=UPI003BA87218
MENGDKKSSLSELLLEKSSLDSSFTHATKLLNAEVERIQKGEPKKDEPDTYLDLFTQHNIKLKERILIPVKQYPRFNFVGKILGPQGNTIKRLQEETGAKISVLGKGSMRDKTKEEELRSGGEPKYAHLSMELHVFMEVFAPVPDAYLRMAHAMEEVKKFLIPDVTDDICQEQFMEMGYLNGGQEHGGRGRGVRGRGGPPGMHRGRGMPTRGAAPRGARGGAVRGAPSGRGGPAAASGRGAAASRARPPAAGPPQRMSSHQQTPAAAAESYDGYGYNENYDSATYDSYGNYYSQQQAEPQYYDYGHGESAESYESYAQDDWNGTQRSAPNKAPPASRGAKTPYREHPYRAY